MFFKCVLNAKNKECQMLPQPLTRHEAAERDTATHDANKRDNGDVIAQKPTEGGAVTCKAAEMGHGHPRGHLE